MHEAPSLAILQITVYKKERETKKQRYREREIEEKCLSYRPAGKRTAGRVGGGGLKALMVGNVHW